MLSQIIQASPDLCLPGLGVRPSASLLLVPGILCESTSLDNISFKVQRCYDCREWAREQGVGGGSDTNIIIMMMLLLMKVAMMVIKFRLIVFSLNKLTLILGPTRSDNNNQINNKRKRRTTMTITRSC